MAWQMMLKNSCFKKSKKKANKTKNFTAIIISLIMLVGICGCIDNEENIKKELSDELNILNWEDYFGETTLEDFEEEFGVKINLFTFQDEDEMISLLDSNPGKYDISLTSNSVIDELIQSKSVEKLEKENIPNILNLNPSYTNLSFDPGNLYCIPYFWGTTGIAINTSIVSEDINSWDILWNESFNKKIAMLNNKEEVIAVALKYLGYSVNTNNISQLNEAEKLLLNQKELIQGYFDPITIKEKLISGDLIIAHCYVGEAFIAAEYNENISYIIPKEGSPLWIDCFFIPIDAKNKYTAEVFLNYLLDPEVNAEIMNYQWIAGTNLAAEDYVNVEILNDEKIFPPASIINKCEFFKSPDGNTLSEYNRIWAALKS